MQARNHSKPRFLALMKKVIALRKELKFDINGCEGLFHPLEAHNEGQK
jgi:hypothetical protein